MPKITEPQINFARLSQFHKVKEVTKAACTKHKWGNPEKGYWTVEIQGTVEFRQPAVERGRLKIPATTTYHCIRLAWATLPWATTKEEAYATLDSLKDLVMIRDWGKE